jgi:hypothetical protein
VGGLLPRWRWSVVALCVVLRDNKARQAQRALEALEYERLQAASAPADTSTNDTGTNDTSANKSASTDTTTAPEPSASSGTAPP